MPRVGGILAQYALPLLLFLLDGGLECSTVSHVGTLLVVMVVLLNLAARGALPHLFRPAIRRLQDHFLLAGGLLRVVYLALCCLLRVQQTSRHGFQTVNDALLRLDLRCCEQHLPVVQ